MEAIVNSSPLIIFAVRPHPILNMGMGVRMSSYARPEGIGCVSYLISRSICPFEVDLCRWKILTT